jgi:hypothetical protein
MQYVTCTEGITKHDIESGDAVHNSYVINQSVMNNMLLLRHSALVVAPVWLPISSVYWCKFYYHCCCTVSNRFANGTWG